MKLLIDISLLKTCDSPISNELTLELELLTIKIQRALKDGKYINGLVTFLPEGEFPCDY